MIYLLALAGLLCGSLIYGYRVVAQKRARMVGLPTPPVKYWWLGNIDIMVKAAMLFPDDAHPQHIFTYIGQKYNMPSVWYMDLWPISLLMMLTNDPQYSAQYATTGQSLPKARNYADYLDKFLGVENPLTSHGSYWKSQRNMFNPGFSAAHLMTLVPYVVESTLTFVDIMQKKARNNEIFELEECATRLSIDIIGKVALDADFDSQRHDHPLVRAFRERTPLMENAANPVQLFRDLQFIRIWKLRRNEKVLDGLMSKEIDRAIARRGQSNTATGPPGQRVAFKDRKRSIVDLALDAYYSEKMVTLSGGNVKPGKEMDAEFRAEAIKCVKTFIFAGHDTVSSTLSCALYLLHHHPTIRGKLLAELRTVFQSHDLGATFIASAINTDPHLLNSLSYTTAVIKETLRVFTPASTLRSSMGILPGADPNEEHFLPNPDYPNNGYRQQYPLFGKDLSFWPMALMIHRNKEYFPEPEAFVPERWDRENTPYPETKLFTEQGKEAWVAFGKGPRNCIGEQLALIEIRTALALVVGSGLDFVAELEGGRVAACAVSGVDAEGMQLGENRRAPVTALEDTSEWEERVKSGKKGGEGGEEEGSVGKTRPEDYIQPEDEARMKKWRGRTFEGYSIYQKIMGTAKPAYGMLGRIYSVDQ